MIGAILKRIEKYPKAALLLQFVKFGLVGITNTAISYAIEMLCYYVLFVHTSLDRLRGWLEEFSIHLTAANTKIILTSVIAFIVSVTNSYYWNNKHVFASSEAKSFGQHVKTYFKTMLCYAVTGLLLSPWCKTIMVEVGIPYWLSTLLVLIVTIPLNFVMNKLWAFGNKQKAK